MRGGRVAIAAVIAVLLGLVFAGGALACSCAPSTPAESLAGSDAAVSARLLGVTPQGGMRAEYRYEVLHVYRGRGEIEPGSTISVLSPRGSAACGLPDGIGRRFGLFLLADGRHGWSSGLCGVIAPRRLWAAARHGGGASPQGAGASCAS